MRPSPYAPSARVPRESPRGGTRPVKRAILAVATVIFAVSACTQNAEEDDPPPSNLDEEFFDSESAGEEYQRVAESLEWPEGVTPPDQSYESGNYQAGVGEGDAVMAWNCAWGLEWLDSRNSDPDAADYALEMYASVVETRTFQQYFDTPLQEHVVEVIERAELGDPSQLQSDVMANCTS